MGLLLNTTAVLHAIVFQSVPSLCHRYTGDSKLTDACYAMVTFALIGPYFCMLDHGVEDMVWLDKCGLTVLFWTISKTAELLELN